MNVLPFLAMLFVVSIPFWALGWWLMRNSRSVDDLVKTLDDHGIDSGDLPVGRGTSAWWLLANPLFVVFLVRGRYRRMELPPDVLQALEIARADYLRGLGVFTAIILIGFAVSLYNGT